MDNGFQGLEGQTMPVMPGSFVDTVTDRYIELYEAITGTTFDKGSYDSMNTDIENSVITALK